MSTQPDTRGENDVRPGRRWEPTAAARVTRSEPCPGSPRQGRVRPGGRRLTYGRLAWRPPGALAAGACSSSLYLRYRGAVPGAIADGRRPNALQAWDIAATEPAAARLVAFRMCPSTPPGCRSTCWSSPLRGLGPDVVHRGAGDDIHVAGCCSRACWPRAAATGREARSARALSPPGSCWPRNSANASYTLLLSPDHVGPACRCCCSGLVIDRARPRWLRAGPPPGCLLAWVQVADSITLDRRRPAAGHRLCRAGRPHDGKEAARKGGEETAVSSLPVPPLPRDAPRAGIT